MSLCSEAEETGGQLYLSMEEISAMLNQLSVQVNQIHLKVSLVMQALIDILTNVCYVHRRERS